LYDGTALRLVWIDAGGFTMGSRRRDVVVRPRRALPRFRKRPYTH